MNPRYLPAYVKKKKYSKFPSNWIQKNGVYVNPSDTRKYPFPITTISPVDYEYEYDVDDPNYWGILSHYIMINVKSYVSYEYYESLVL